MASTIVIITIALGFVRLETLCDFLLASRLLFYRMWQTCVLITYNNKIAMSLIEYNVIGSDCPICFHIATKVPPSQLEASRLKAN